MLITILGGGSFGSALAIYLAAKGYQINVWEFLKQRAELMQQSRKSDLLKGAVLQDNIRVDSDLAKMVTHSQIIFFCVPSEHFAVTAKNVAPFITRQKIVIVTKGLTNQGELLSEIVARYVNNRLYVLSGPTHAEELYQNKFGGAVLASKRLDLEMQNLIQSANFKIELSKDMIGLQICAALKNVYAILLGIAEGLKLGDNAKAYLASKSLGEIEQVVVGAGGKVQTVYGLGGIGDLLVTAYSQHSRNRFFGQKLAEGKTSEQIFKELNMVVEGYYNLKQAVFLKQKYKLRLPLLTKLEQIVNGEITPQQMIF